MKLSIEQSDIIHISQGLKYGEVMKIDACAGSGKTSTLIEITKANPNTRYLYLAFNKSIAMKASTLFPANCTCMTMHSLAYRNVFKSRRFVLGNVKPRDLKQIFPSLNSYRHYEILMKYKNFLNSDESNFPSRNIKKIFEAVEKGLLPCMHDHYLKIFEMQNAEEQGISQAYDCILIDESQDANPVMLSIMKKATCSKIFVGDSHQSIYGFRGAVNALASQKATVTKHLSISFRSTQDVLDRANFCVGFYQNLIYEGKQPYIRMKCHSDEVSLRNQQHAIITRTNSKLVDVIYEYKDTPEEALLMKNPDDVFKMPIAMYEFQYARKRNFWGELAFLNDFKDMDMLEKYIEATMDNELMTAIRISEKYKKMLYVLKSKAEDMTDPEAPIVLTNAHTSKGLEWKSVKLMDDFLDLGGLYAKCLLAPMDDIEGFKALPFIEQRNITFHDFLQELNLYYVAITRAQIEVQDSTPNASYRTEKSLKSHIDSCIKKRKSDIERQQMICG